MKDNCILIIPVINENPLDYSKLLKTVKSSNFCYIVFSVSAKNRYQEAFTALSKSEESCYVLISEKNYKRSKLYKNALSFINKNLKEENSYNYIMSIKKYTDDYIDLIIEGLQEIEKTSLDIIYCLAENRKRSFKSRVRKRIKKSILDTFRSPLFIASHKFVNTIYSNPFNKMATFYHLIRNAKPPKPIYS